jgi:hypothetical protein
MIAEFILGGTAMMKILSESVSEERKECLCIPDKIEEIIVLLAKAEFVYGDDQKLIGKLAYAKAKIQCLIEAIEKI